mmetsp:Transcript_12076/g.18058  ORF Transcript_12076/g.18058 Transcript_12076/m.18058 type:complete len:250 (+) Transcript_12076:31-780(+)
MGNGDYHRGAIGMFWCGDDISRTSDTMSSLHKILVNELGAMQSDRWTVDVAFKYKQGTKKSLTDDNMRFGVNTALSMITDKTDSSSQSTFDKFYIVRRSELSNVVCIAQERSKQIDIGDLTIGENLAESVINKRFPYPTRLKGAIEGMEYEMGDFDVRVGTCRKGGTSGGVVMEIEYKPFCGNQMTSDFPIICTMKCVLDPASMFKQVEVVVAPDRRPRNENLIESDHNDVLFRIGFGTLLVCKVFALF